MEAISTPSMMIWPPEASRILKRLLVRDDFPAPVLPTTPICKEFLGRLVHRVIHGGQAFSPGQVERGGKDGCSIPPPTRVC